MTSPIVIPAYAGMTHFSLTRPLQSPVIIPDSGARRCKPPGLIIFGLQQPSQRADILLTF